MSTQPVVTPTPTATTTASPSAVVPTTPSGATPKPPSASLYVGDLSPYVLFVISHFPTFLPIL